MALVGKKQIPPEKRKLRDIKREVRAGIVPKSPQSLPYTTKQVMTSLSLKVHGLRDWFLTGELL